MRTCSFIVVTMLIALGCELDEARTLREESLEVAPEQLAPRELPSVDLVEVAHDSESPGAASDAEEPKGMESQDHLATAEHPDWDRLDEIGDVPDVSEVTCSCKTCNWASYCNMPLGSCGCTIYMWHVTPPRTCYDDRPIICLCD